VPIILSGATTHTSATRACAGRARTAYLERAESVDEDADGVQVDEVADLAWRPARDVLDDFDGLPAARIVLLHEFQQLRGYLGLDQRPDLRSDQQRDG
jgi:hypothetical protein